MATNRFDQYVPYRSTYRPRQFTPNFQMLQQALAGQQKQYDALQQAARKLPEFIDVDRDDVMAYKQELDKRMQGVTSAYEQGLSQGNRARRDMVNQLIDDWSPTGRAAAFQSNFNSYQDYMKQLDEELKDKRITKDIRDAALMKSRTDFGKTFKDFSNPGQANTFSGYRTAEDVSIVEFLDNFYDGWKPDTIRGRKVGTALNGEFYYVDSGGSEFVKQSDLIQEGMRAIQADPAASAAIRQRNELFGDVSFATPVVDEKGNPVLDENGEPMMTTGSTGQGTFMAGEAIKATSNKYAYLKQIEDFQLYKNWAAAQRRDHAFQREMEQPLQHINSVVFKTGLGKNNFSEDNWVGRDISDIDKKIKQLSTMIKTSGGSPFVPTGSYRTEIEKELSQLRAQRDRLKNNPQDRDLAASKFFNHMETVEGAQEYPDMAYVMEQVPRLRDEQNQTIESDADYLARLTKAHNDYVDDISVNHLKIAKFSDDAMADQRISTFGAKGKGTGDGAHMSWYEVDPRNEVSPPISFDNMLKETGLFEIHKEDPGSVSTRVAAIGTISPDNISSLPSGTQWTIVDDDGRSRTFVASVNSLEQERIRKPLRGLAQPMLNPAREGWNGLKGHSDVQDLYLGGQRLRLVSKSSSVFSEDGTYQGIREEGVFPVIRNADGTETLGERLQGTNNVPLTLNEIMTISEQNDIYRRQ
jgi:hypothetical protein